MSKTLTGRKVQRPELVVEAINCDSTLVEAAVFTYEVLSHPLFAVCSDNRVFDA